MLSAGVDVAKVALTRYLPLKVFVSDPVPDRITLEKIVNSIETLLNEEGFERADEFPEETGSWWKKLVLRTKNVATHEQVIDRIKKAERAAEIAILDKPQAEANQCQAEAASSLISSLGEIANACIQAGSLLVVKATNNGKSSIIARTLTPMELKHLEENQAVLRKPGEILEWLQNIGNKRLTKSSS